MMAYTYYLLHFVGALPPECNKTFFGLPPWYKYLDVAPGSCEIQNFTLLGSGTNSSLILIALAVVDMLLRIAAIVSVIFVMWGGFNMITSQADPQNVAKARHTIINALVGLVLSILATSMVVFVGNRLAP